eukprot:1924857-Amphidinium_carterae.1
MQDQSHQILKEFKAHCYFASAELFGYASNYSCKSTCKLIKQSLRTFCDLEDIDALIQSSHMLLASEIRRCAVALPHGLLFAVCPPGHYECQTMER